VRALGGTTGSSDCSDPVSDLDNFGTASISKSRFLHDFRDGYFASGGAIFNIGSLDVREASSQTTTLPLAASVLAPLLSEGPRSGTTGEVAIDNSQFSGNRSTDGGSIFNLGTLDVTNSGFSDNIGGNGGAIYDGNGGTLTIKSSWLSGNGAGYGGAISNGGQAGLARWGPNLD
jgi:hypothetical protein